MPVLTSHASGRDGLRVRGAAGELAAFVLDSLRGLPEILQYGAGAARLRDMQERTEALTRDRGMSQADGGAQHRHHPGPSVVL